MAGPRDLFHLVGATALGRYRIEEVVGENAYAVVYRGTDGGAAAALKVFKVLGEFSSEERESALDLLVLQSAAVAKVAQQSELICGAKDVGRLNLRTSDWVPCMTFAWLDGASLRQIRDEEQQYGLPPRTIAQAMSLLEPAAMALATAHQAGVVHAGLTPSSVFVLGDPRAANVRLRLIDFGVARAITEARAGKRNRNAPAFALTPTYYKAEFAAPEQVDFTGHPIDTATDVFSFALVIAFLLSYPPADPAAAREQSYYRGTPGARGVPVPDAVERVFARALSRDPHERPATVGELWNDLRTARGLAALSDLAGGDEIDESPQDAPTLRVQPLDDAEVERLVALPSGGTSEADNTQRRAAVSVPPSSASRAVGWGLVLALVIGFGAFGYRFREAIARRFESLLGAQSAAPTVTSAPPVVSASAAPPPKKAPCPKNMVLVAGGDLRMGRKDDTTPGVTVRVHDVKLASFCMDVNEVTVARYKACSDRGACKRASKTNEWQRIRGDERATYDPECNIQHPKERAQHPINCVTWEMADIFCKAEDKMLPSEAQWERAARGTDSRPYPWGREDPDEKRLNACGRECVAWHQQRQKRARALYDADDGWPVTSPVATFARGASPYGVHDMAGNVWEWVADWYAPYPEEPQVEPAGPPTGQHRVVRGGGFQVGEPAQVRATFRHHDLPSTSSWNIGFRCAHDPL